MLIEVMKSGDDVNIRMAAAKELIAHDNPAGAIDEWRRIPLSGKHRWSAGIEPALDVLLPSGKTEAMQEVVKDWDKRIVGDRFRSVKNPASGCANRHVLSALFAVKAR